MTAGRPKQPLALAVSNGMTQAQPTRYQGREDYDEPPIGAVPYYFDHMQREAWNDIVAKVWWLRASDYHATEGAALTLAIVRTRQDVDTIVKFMGMMSKLGATPTSRGSILFPKDAGKKSRFG